jgi:mannan endo-1,4-beta-mannosidase
MYVRVSGNRFELNQLPFPVNGGNCYYATLRSDLMAQAAFQVCAKAGFNVLRTWAFLDVTAPGDSAWFQCGPGKFNDGPNGLQLLDRTIQLAEQHNVRLILPLVNY